MTEKQHEELSEIMKKMIQEIAENRKQINEMKEFISHLVKSPQFKKDPAITSGSITHSAVSASLYNPLRVGYNVPKQQLRRRIYFGLPLKGSNRSTVFQELIRIRANRPVACEEYFI